MAGGRIRLVLCLAVAALAAPQVASADWTPLGTVGTGASAHVAMDAQGRFTFIWLQGGALKAAGTGFTTPATLEASGASDPDLVAGPSGVIGATWVKNGTTVRSARRVGTGSFTDIRDVAPASATAATSPRIGLDANGNPIVAWLEDQANPTTPAPRSVHLAAGTAGAPYASAESTSDDNYVSSLDIAVDDAGRATVLWQSEPCFVDGCHEWYVNYLYRPQGGPIGSVTHVESSGTDWLSPLPSEGVDGDGNAVAIWRVYCTQTAGVSGLSCPGKPEGIYVRTATKPAGSGFGTFGYLSDEVGLTAGSLPLAVAHDGGAIAGFVSSAGPFAVTKPAGGVFSAPQPLDTSGSDLAVGAADGGHTLAAWVTSDGVRAAAGGSTTTISAAGAGAPEVAGDASGDGVAVWERSGSIEAARYAPPVPVAATTSNGGGNPGIAPRDDQAPAVTLKLPKHVKLRALLKGIKLRTTCSESCAVTVNLFRGHKRIGRATGQRAGAGGLTLKLRPNARARRQLRPGKLLVQLSAHDLLGNNAPVIRRTLRVSR